MAKAGVYVSVVGDSAQSVKAFKAARDELDKLGRDAGVSEGKVGRLRGGLSKVGTAAKAGFAAAAGAATAFAASGVKAFSEFQEQMNEVFTLLPGISEKEMGKMSGQVKDFAKEFGVLPEKVVPALYQALSAGVPKKNVFEFMEGAQKLAKGGVTDLTTAVDGLSSVTNAYGADVIDAATASDIMFTTVKLGKTTVGEMSSSLSNVIPAAAAAGVTFEEVGAAIAALTSQGIPTAQATTQMRSAIVELTQGAGKASKAFVEISGKTFPEFIKGGGTMQEALQMMEKEAKKNGASLLDMFGSVEGGSAALALTGRGTETFVGNLEAMGGASGAADQAFATMDSGMASTMDKLKARVKVMSIDVGEKISSIGPMWLSLGLQAAASSGKVLMAVSSVVAGAAHMAASTLASIVKAVAKWAWMGVQALAHAAKVAAAWVLASGPAAIAAVAAVVAAAAVFVGRWVWMGAQALLGAAKVAAAWLIALGPIGLLIAAVAGAVALIVVHWDTIKEAATKVWEWVSEKFTALVEFVKGLPGKIAAAASGMWDGIKGAFMSAVNAIIRIWNGLEFKIPGFKVGPVGFEGFTLGVPDIPELADGGRTVRGGLAVVGERGRELVDLPSGAEVRPLDRAGEGGPRLTMNVTALDPREAARIAAAEWAWLEKVSGY